MNETNFTQFIHPSPKTKKVEYENVGQKICYFLNFDSAVDDYIYFKRKVDKYLKPIETIPEWNKPYSYRQCGNSAGLSTKPSPVGSILGRYGGIKAFVLTEYIDIPILNDGQKNLTIYYAFKKLNMPNIENTCLQFKDITFSGSFIS